MSKHNSKEIENRARLFKAAESGDVQALHQLPDRDQLLGVYSDNDLRIALQKAAQAGIEEAVQVLLDKGAKTDVIVERGLPPLHRAAIKGHTRVIKLLLDYGADPEIRDQSGQTAYTYAALNGQNSVLAFLQAHHIDINAVDHDDKTALHALAADGENRSQWNRSQWNRETVQILLQGCPDLDKVDKLGRTALHWAAATGKAMVASQILKVSAGKALARARATTNRGKTALHLAAANDHAEMVTLLMQNGALVDKTSEGNWTALLNAAKNGHVTTVDVLLKSGANVNARTSIGMTALHWAAELGHLGVVRRILEEQKAWKNSKDNFDSTPLMRAGQHGHHEIIQALRPHLFGSLSPDAIEACERFTASVVDFYCDVKALRRCIVKKISVYEALYAIDPDDISRENFAVTTLIEDIQPHPPDFRWIHLPSNNVAWAEALITKFFLEKGLKGATNAAGFKAMIRVLAQQQHRGPGVYSRYMRPGCQRVSDGESQTGHRRRPKSRNLSPAKTNEPLVPSLWVNSQETVYKDIIILFVSISVLKWRRDTNLSEQDAIPTLGDRL
jgi:ankyrin repeat protein